MLVIGLTGPSGAGKSTVSRLFASFGLPVLDADEIYHALLIPPSECLNDLTAQFGRQILRGDGTLDRPALGRLVFDHPEALERLNAVSHRHVLREVRRRLRTLRDEGVTAAVLDAPQLFESGADRDCSVIVSVLADAELRVHRILLRDGISREDAMRRIRAQRPDSFFRAHSDYVIENNGNAESLLPQVRRILRETGVASG